MTCELELYQFGDAKADGTGELSPAMGELAEAADDVEKEGDDAVEVGERINGDKGSEGAANCT